MTSSRRARTTRCGTSSGTRPGASGSRSAASSPQARRSPPRWTGGRRCSSGAAMARCGTCRTPEAARAPGHRWAAFVAEGTAPGCGVPEIASVDVFVIGPDGQLWQSSGSVGGQDPDSWDPWLKVARNPPLPAQGIASGPSVVALRAPATTTSSSRAATMTCGMSNTTGRPGAGGRRWAGRQPPDLRPRPWAASLMCSRSAPTARSGAWPAQGGGWASLGGFAQYGVGALAGNNVFIASTNGFLQHNWLGGRRVAWLGGDQRTDPAYRGQLRRRVDLDGLLRHLAGRYHGLPLPGAAA